MQKDIEEQLKFKVKLGQGLRIYLKIRVTSLFFGGGVLYPGLSGIFLGGGGGGGLTYFGKHPFSIPKPFRSSGGFSMESQGDPG